MSSANLVTLLTDFGLDDTYVAQMKAVVIGLNPRVRLVDLTHGVRPGGVLEAALALESAWRLFPAGSIHLAVVDPGVGSPRWPLALSAGGHYFVGPDNGLFTLVLSAHPEARLVRLREDFRPVSATFHGRDVFAPAAALLALGTPLAELGEPVPGPRVSLALLEVRREAGRLSGAVWHADRFGNLICNLRREDVGAKIVTGVVAGGARLTLGRTYCDVAPGECLALWGSGGWLELACRGASAAEHLGLAAGGAVTLQLSTEE